MFSVIWKQYQKTLKKILLAQPNAHTHTMSLESIRYSNGKLEILDQLLLPAQNKYVSVKGVEDGWKVINRMQVRGAPAIAIVGCLSLAVELFDEQFSDKKSLRQEIEGKLNYLVSARPTAVNVSGQTKRKIIIKIRIFNFNDHT